MMMMMMMMFNPKLLPWLDVCQARVIVVVGVVVDVLIVVVLVVLVEDCLFMVRRNFGQREKPTARRRRNGITKGVARALEQGGENRAL
jgi:hypothetical protein